MSYQTKQRTRIEDLSVDGNELFELSEEMMMMVGGGYNLSDYVGYATVKACSSTGQVCGGDTDTCDDWVDGCA
jgi:hypothetical protein